MEKACKRNSFQFINLITTIMAKQVKKEKPQTGGGTGAPDKGK